MNQITIEYANRFDGTQPLLADVAWVPDGRPKPILVVMHGYGCTRQDVALDLRELAPQGVIAVAPDMRGRGGSAGEWDSGGFDVCDIIAAVEHMVHRPPANLSGEIDPGRRHIVGYSGGGGNAIACACRFPDYFQSATSFFGISDYAGFHRASGRPDCNQWMETAIGKPDEHPLVFAARNMIPAAGNAARVKMKLFWDSEETQCPPAFVEKWIRACRAAGGRDVRVNITRPGDAKRWIHHYRSANPDLSSADRFFMPDVLAVPAPGRLDLPLRGELFVPGYLRTRHFAVYLNTARCEGTARVRYDLTGPVPMVELLDVSPGLTPRVDIFARNGEPAPSAALRLGGTGTPKTRRRGRRAQRASPAHRRPCWLKDGIVAAGNWSSWMARTQRINVCWTQTGYGLTDSEAGRLYRKEFTAEMANRLKSAGATLVILPYWSGMGSLDQERPGMEDTRRFARLLHARGLRVGVYIHNMNLSRGFLLSRPDAYDWLAWPAPGQPFAAAPPPETESEGYPVYRNHPDHLRFMFELVEKAIREVRADYLHFDNFVNQTGFSPCALAHFRDHLRARYTARELKDIFGLDNLDAAGDLAFRGEPPLVHEWTYFQGWALAESYRKLAGYARSLNPEVAVELNAAGIYKCYRRPINLPLLLPHGDAFWDEHSAAWWNQEKRMLGTGIRSYKLARLFRQHALLYTAPGLTMCQALVFNHDSLGCPFWFLYARLQHMNKTPPAGGLRHAKEVRFFHAHRGLFRGGETLAEVAVFRGHAVNLCGPEAAAESAYWFEQAMIVRHIPFDIIFDEQLQDLRKYRVVVLPDVRWLGDAQIRALLRFAKGGGALVVTDHTALRDQLGRPRDNPPACFFRRPPPATGRHIERFGKGRILYTMIKRPPAFADGSLPENDGELAQVVRRAAGSLSVAVEAPPEVAVEAVRSGRKLLVHFLNYAGGCTAVPLRIRAAESLGRFESARLISPYLARPLNCRAVRRAGCTEVVVPPFHLYALLVAETKRGGKRAQS